jgi:hypothetical protein
MYITNSLLTEFDQELHDRCTYEDGVAEGAQQNAIANAKNALDMGLTPEQIAQITSLPLEQVLALKDAETMHNA